MHAYYFPILVLRMHKIVIFIDIFVKTWLWTVFLGTQKGTFWGPRGTQLRICVLAPGVLGAAPTNFTGQIKKTSVHIAAVVPSCSTVAR